MRMWAHPLFLLLAAATLAVPNSAFAQNSLSVHVFGVSYHYQSSTYLDDAGVTRHYEQLNPGLGVEYLVSDGPRLVTTAEGGAYRDSKDRTNVFAGPAWRLRAGPHLLLGGGIVVMTSRTYGTPVAPLPLVTGRWTHASVNATWIPSLASQESGAVALFATIHF
jgi:hypothetical protein